MSKHHKNRNHNQQPAQQPVAEQPKVESPAEVPTADVADLGASLLGAEDVTPAEETQPAEPAATPEPPKSEPVSTIVPTATTQTPAPAVAVEPEKPKVRVMAIRRHTAPATNAKRVASVIAAARIPGDSPKVHTAAGSALIKMFDEYDDLCRRGENNVDLQVKAAYKLNDIMNTCCPRRGNQNAAYYQELVNIVFRRLSTGYNTKYSEAKLFRHDYRLPTPLDSMRFDTFWHAMYELVEAAKTGRRISFNTTSVAQILKSTEVMLVIQKLRRAIEHRND